MIELDVMIEIQVVVKTVGRKETPGILTSLETLGSIHGNSYLISIDKEIVIPMYSVYRISLKDRFKRDKKEEMGKEKSEVSLNSPPSPFGLQKNVL